MKQPDERTALLPRDAETVNAVSDHDQDASTHTQSLRRRSAASLPPYHEDHAATEEPSSSGAIWTVIPLSLLGIFVANADGSLVVAASQQIASEFNSLTNASWIVTSFGLALCASQPLYGKLSDIFGRKSNLTAAYTLFAIGCFLCGIGKTYGQVIAGRVISGMGAAGMTALVSVIIADMVPVREVATWRSYVNVAATTGRALGGPVGGWLTDTIGWRWCFYGQVPFTVVGLLLILWRMPTKSSRLETEDQKWIEKVKRVDGVGAILLASTIVSFLVCLDCSSKDLPRAYTIVPGVLFLVLATVFVLVEKKWAKEPVLPIELLVKRPALTSYLITGFQLAAQFGTFYATPLYFQIASGVSVANAGLRLVPAVVGNAMAGLLAGYAISKTGRYKVTTVVASGLGIIGYTLITIRWRGHTSWWETLYIFFGGFASGAVQSTTFIHLAASLDASEMAIAGTMLYTSQGIFLLIGIQLATTVLFAKLRVNLDIGLKGNNQKEEIIKHAISSVHSIRRLPEVIQHIVTQAYVDSLRYAFALSIGFATLGLIIGLTIKERKL